MEADERGLRLAVETDQLVEGCRDCGVLAVLHDRREHLLHDAPFGHRQVLVRWRKRIWRCAEPACAVVTFSETHPLAAPRALLTRRAVVWAADALSEDDTAVAALARRLDVDWHTLWDALAVEAERRTAEPGRLHGVESPGVDEHIWRPVKFGSGREVTCMVDLSRDANGQVRAGPLDLVLGRSGPSYGAGITAQPAPFRAGIKHAALDPFRARRLSGVPLGRVPDRVVEQGDGRLDDQRDGSAGEPGVPAGLAGVPSVPWRISAGGVGAGPAQLVKSAQRVVWRGGYRQRWPCSSRSASWSTSARGPRAG